MGPALASGWGRSQFLPWVLAAADVRVESSEREAQCVRLGKGWGASRGSAAREVPQGFGSAGGEGDGTLRGGNAGPSSARTRS
jgi:hypothetical protein